MDITTLLIATALIVALSMILSPRVRTTSGFFRGYTEDGTPPNLGTLIFSQVTTWIFARSLLTAAILGYYYGIAGALAYTAYYLSFFTGGAIVQSIRFRHGYSSVQDFLRDRFGKTGTATYNFVIGIRLLSEVFANMLVVGAIFGVAGSTEYLAAILILAAVILVYSMMGGLRASLRTDVFQMSLFGALLAYLFVVLLDLRDWSITPLFEPKTLGFDAGWHLLVVALLQVWSYPMHDPVMMDRGFLADQQTTRRSFFHAGWISMLCILIFALLGVHAGQVAVEGEVLNDTLTRILGTTSMTVLNIVLIISALSTLDSTLSSSAKLAVVDMKLVPETVLNGRLAMVVAMLGGLVFLFAGSKDLYSAVAVSGTASMYLAPVIFFCIWGNREVALWAYLTSFAAALGGAALYFVEAGGASSLMTPLLGIEHKYTKLLVICVAVLAIGNLAFALGLKRTQPRLSPA
ncbi:hypothetical protein [Coralliovum pocilloporae]|uniref:hypothetical protein n=1 Tax=Coralliovum pocilloporae TaxID=3066369 RepID=UPI0033075709